VPDDMARARVACPVCAGTFERRGRRRYCSHACRQAAYEARAKGRGVDLAKRAVARRLTAEITERDRALLRLYDELEAKARPLWTVDDRNALMALHLYFDEGSSWRGDDVVLRECSAPAVAEVTFAEELAALLASRRPSDEGAPLH
jgi:hypothetical protein